jgi:hypothetical protein
VSDFATAQAGLLAAQAAQADARRAARQAVETQRALAAEQAQLAATADPQHPDGRTAALERELRAAEVEVKAHTVALQQAQGAAAAAVAGFAEFSDPRRNVARLSDRSPFAMLPVRIETRFADAGGPDAPRPQLWVRIYPDDCSIDTFEAALSTTEVANAKVYWQRLWRAGGVEADERAAWRDLVAAHGSGRAGYIVDNYAPTNAGAAPTKANPDDEILVVPTQTAPAAADAAAISSYWQAVWGATTDADLQAAETALETAVGRTHATELKAAYVPFNLSDTPAAPATKQTVSLSTAFVVFPPDPPPKQFSWSEAPQISQLPERFVVLGYRGGAQVVEAVGEPVASPLYVGPDPSADPNDSIHPDGPNLVVPDELKWLVDFPTAVAAGMGIAVDLQPDDARAGFDRLLVLGVQLAPGDTGGKTTLEELLTHHHVGRSGLSLVPQGTPAHNTTGAGAGYTRLDNADQSFDDRRNAPLFSVVSDPNEKRDGLWLAEALGIDPGVLTGVHGAGGVDQRRARAMQRALWPATIGYWLDKMMTPVFGDETVAETRQYFTGFVSGRGALPAIRIGSQAYGILPTTAFSRIAWLDEQRLLRPLPAQSFLARLYALLRAIDGDWTTLSSSAAHVGAPGDAHQTLLDIVGLHPDSVEFYWRYSESISELYNVVNLWGIGPAFWAQVQQLALEAPALALLGRLGYGGAQPDLLRHIFLTDSGLVDVVVDDHPSSETQPLPEVTPNHKNYIGWLIEAAQASLDTVTGEHGFTNDQTPTALLYLFLRHALLLGYYDTSYELHKSAGFLSAVELARMKPEPAFIHVDENATTSESRYAALYKLEPRITQSPSSLVSDYITQNVAGLAEAAGLADQIDALAALVDAPTAELERLFAEHIDVCSYRFDAWLLGLVNVQLQQMRARGVQNGNGGGTTGVYLGAYAWVEDLRPSTARLEPVQLDADLGATFADPAPLRHDPVNGGFIHAPSLPHARTAAVLRSGYLANATADAPDTLAINLSSDRVRLALTLLEGVRNGQSIGALLGYQFERGLHDAHGLAEVDKFIYPLRKAFPLVADSLSSTATPPDVPIEAIEARNVLDGRKLLAQVRTPGNTAYPFGVADLPAATAAEAAAINAQVNAISDVNDAVADVALAESVHQAVQGNFDRVAATLDAYGSATFPPDPEVVQTPAPGIGLTHRVALQLRPGLAAPLNATPRTAAEPAVDDWLAGVLPNLAQIGCTVTWTDPVGSAHRSHAVTLADLGLRPLDVLELIKPDDLQTMAELDDRVLDVVRATVAPRGDAALRIEYQTRPAGASLSFFEASALIRNLRTLLRGARPLRASDTLLTNDARPSDNANLFADRARVGGPKGELDTLVGDLHALLTTLQGLVADPVANRGPIVTGSDGFLASGVALLERAARFGVPQSGWGFAYEWRRSAMAALFAAVDEHAQAWQTRLDAFDQKLADYNALALTTPDTVRFQILQAAEALVVAVLEPLPPLPATLLSDLPPKRHALQLKQDAFVGVLGANHPSFTAALAAVEALLPVDAFDQAPFDLDPFRDRAVTFVEDLTRTLTSLYGTLTDRAAKVAAQLQAYDDATTGPGRAEALQAAAKALLGDSFVLVPEFALSADQGAQLTNAVAAGAGPLLDYLQNTAKIERPVEEWLAGAARVRPMLHAWETIGMLCDAFERPALDLVPAQLPYEANAPWLAMQFPPTYAITGDRLLYAAHYTAAFDASAHQCGLLLDEWTEVIPGTTKDTGLAFNFDRPDNEPPQSILLVTPATANGQWQWEDLVGALNETLDLAKKRALEPSMLDPTAYSRFLPATIMAVTLYGISITTALAVASNVMHAPEVLRRA